MSIFGDIFKSILPAAASFIPGIGQIAGPALAAMMSGMNGGGAGGNSLANMLAGMATAQRIPGQTQAGEYTPPEGGFGTYNYIPTGASQIDPQLLQMIMGSAGMNQGAVDWANPINTSLAIQGINNPYASSMIGNLAGTGDQAINFGSDMLAMAPGLTQGAYNTTWQAGNLLQQAQNNPFTQQMIQGAQNIGQSVAGAGAGLQGGAQDYMSNVANTVGSLNANPYTQLAQAGGNQAGSMMQSAGMGGFNQGQQFSNAAGAGIPAAQAVLGTAFDPQDELYARALTNTQDQLGVHLARTGLTNSGAGAGIAADALKNFNIDWQNNQLGRQLEGLSGYTSAMTGAGNNLGQGQNLQTGGASTYAQGAALPAQTYQNLGAMKLDNLGQVGAALGTGANVMPTAANLQFGGNSAGYDASMGNLASLGNFISGYGNAVQGQGTMANNVGQIGNNAINMMGAGAQMPFQGYQNYYNGANSALGNFYGNASAGSDLLNQNVGQGFDYLRAVNSGAQTAGSNASGAQNSTASQNASAAAGLSPRIQGGINGLGSLFNSIFNRQPQVNSAYPSWATGR